MRSSRTSAPAELNRPTDRLKSTRCGPFCEFRKPSFHKTSAATLYCLRVCLFISGLGGVEPFAIHPRLTPTGFQGENQCTSLIRSFVAVLPRYCSCYPVQRSPQENPKSRAPRFSITHAERL